MNIIILISIIVVSIAFYVALCYAFTYLTKGEEPLWLQIFCFPFDFARMPFVFLYYLKDLKMARIYCEGKVKEQAILKDKRGM